MQSRDTGDLTLTKGFHCSADSWCRRRWTLPGFWPTELIHDDEEPGFPTMTELIRGAKDHDQLSIFTCKAITWEIHPYQGFRHRADSLRRRWWTFPGYPTATELVHSDDEDRFLEATPYQEFSPTELIYDDEQQECPPMTELIYSTEGQDLFSVFTCKAITWEISPLPGFRRQRGFVTTKTVNLRFYRVKP